MDPYKETFETWNKVAKLYQDKFMDLDLYDDTYDNFCEQINKSNPTILEIGCGPGNITKYLLNKRPDFEIFAIDFSPNMITMAKTNCPKANFIVMDSRKIDKLKTKFDAVVCGFCLPYLTETDVEKLIYDSNTLLNDHGIIYLSFMEGNYDKSGYRAAITGDRTYFYYHPLAHITNVLKANSFEITYSTNKFYNKNKTEEMHTIIIAGKTN